MKYNTATLVFLLIHTIYVEMWSCGNFCSVHICNEAYHTLLDAEVWIYKYYLHLNFMVRSRKPRLQQ
jgi:hypothetical protein